MAVRYSNSAFYLLQILIKLHLIAYCALKGNLHFSYVLEDGYLLKYLVITPKTKKSKLKILQRNFCLFKNEVFRKLLVQKTGRTGPSLVPEQSHTLHHTHTLLSLI